MKMRTEYTCPLELVHDMIKGKWKPIILWQPYLFFTLYGGGCAAGNGVDCHCPGGQGRIPGNRGICMDTLAGSKHNPFLGYGEREPDGG